MGTIAEAAKSYEATTMGNISELPKVSTSVSIADKTFKEGTPDEFTVNYINQDGAEYRVPVTVLSNLKVLLEERPNLQFFKVRKDGSAMNTRYTVIPLE